MNGFRSSQEFTPTFNHAPFHSSSLMAACRRIVRSKAMSILPRCGFGIGTLCDPLRMNPWRLPGRGPIHPRRRNFWMSSARGVSFGSAIPRAAAIDD